MILKFLDGILVTKAPIDLEIRVFYFAYILARYKEVIFIIIDNKNPGNVGIDFIRIVFLVV